MEKPIEEMNVDELFVYKNVMLGELQGDLSFAEDNLKEAEYDMELLKKALERLKELIG